MVMFFAIKLTLTLLEWHLLLIVNRVIEGIVVHVHGAVLVLVVLIL